MIAALECRVIPVVIMECREPGLVLNTQKIIDGFNITIVAGVRSSCLLLSVFYHLS